VGYKGRNLDVCCVDNLENYNPQDLSPCKQLSFLLLLSGDMEGAIYSKLIQKRKVFTHTEAPPTFALCNHKQKRLVVYRATWQIIGKEGGEREVLPACMTAAIRTAYP
jgi:hypothetical protein